MTNIAQQALSGIKQRADKYAALSDAIWRFAETAYLEKSSSESLIAALESEGFRITRSLADIPTAFCAEYGSGEPVIGILGEYDALYGLSQQGGVYEKTPGPNPQSGHGCGHNLLGVGSLAAAVAVKDYLCASKECGTVVYLGCPGEEGGSGKAFMARAGVFDRLDAALTWHPGDMNAVMSTSTLANIQAKYVFTGKSAHAAAAPHTGRSALDAVELMNVGANFLREHIISQARLHYAITDAGGMSPNVVQANASVLYLVRAPKIGDAREIYERVNDIARGAALMTGTSVEIDFMKACSDFLINTTLQSALAQAMEENGTVKPDEADISAAADYIKIMPGGSEMAAKQTMRMLTELFGADCAAEIKLNGAVNDFVLPYRMSGAVMPASTDVGDVSQVCPTAQLGTATCAAGTPGHSWQMVAQGTLPLAHKGMLNAAEILARTAIRLISEPELVKKAKAEHEERSGGTKYASPIPAGVSPRAI